MTGQIKIRVSLESHNFDTLYATEFKFKEIPRSTP